MQTLHPAATWQKTASIDLQTKYHGDPGESEDAISLPKAALFPFLRRHDPDQVQGSGSPPSQHCIVLPSEWSDFMKESQVTVNATSTILPRKGEDSRIADLTTNPAQTAHTLR